MPDHRGKFFLTYEGSYMVKKAFFGGALILVDMDGHDFNIPTNSDAIIQYFAWGSLPVHPIFYVNKTNKNQKKKKKEKNTKVWKKVDWKPERTVYKKGE